MFAQAAELSSSSLLEGNQGRDDGIFVQAWDWIVQTTTQAQKAVENFVSGVITVVDTTTRNIEKCVEQPLKCAEVALCNDFSVAPTVDLNVGQQVSARTT